MTPEEKVLAVIKKINKNEHLISNVRLVDNNQRILLTFDYNNQSLKMFMGFVFLTHNKLVSEFFGFGVYSQNEISMYKSKENCFKYSAHEFKELFHRLQKKLGTNENSTTNSAS